MIKRRNKGKAWAGIGDEVNRKISDCEEVDY
jgi:hypothetical protein